MGSLKVYITCGGKRMEVQKLKVEPENWQHRFDISVVSKMQNNENIISIEMTEVSKNQNEESIILSNSRSPLQMKKTLKEKESTDLDGSVWL